ncbi:hypothetical protein C922_04690 [Plasmodium inui San Antonio 1]|uniref:Uncharacterized protein n=1 Tax=Plasmodium inui San Antonio 1 TaxID=1237626 RepID=W7A095_9APIC|nr:hypothetical protein C922_04690 [Plasmodium inui San Antonio 1]EUD64958.1 hypothetical protein C922_04690 [Plasmodium inui San Antonio 1]
MVSPVFQYYLNHSTAATLVFIPTLLFLPYEYSADIRTIHMIVLWEYQYLKLRRRYYPKNSIVNITVLHGHAYFPTNSTIDMVSLMKLHKGKDNSISRTSSLLEPQYVRQESTLNIIILLE